MGNTIEGNTPSLGSGLDDQGNIKYGRPIMLTLSRISQKYSMFGGLRNLRNHDFLNKIRLHDDLNEQEQLCLRVAKQVCAAERKFTPDVKLKGLSVVIDGEEFDHTNFDHLPNGVTTENASTVPTKDGVAFQGHSSPLSNFYPCKLVADGETASSVEQLFVICKAKECGASEYQINQIRNASTPYMVKRLSKRIKSTDDWNNLSEAKIREYAELKFTTHPDLMQKLLSYPGDHMYEATKEPVFGAGFLLYEAAHISHNMIDKNANLMGRILEDIKRKHKGVTTRSKGPIVAE